MELQADILVIGGGIAGLTFALKAATSHKVCVLFKKDEQESNTHYAQGGIAAVWDPIQDSFESHIQDTHVAGAGICHPDTVELTVRTAPDRIQELIELGVNFSRAEHQPAEFDLGREGGHSERRILHAKDLTGKEILRALLVAAHANPNITFFEHHPVIDLITTQRLRLPGPPRIVGAYVLNAREGRVYTFRAPVILLSTGGCGKVYLYTSNPDVATGDGVAMAWRAGARVANMEFIQFHPTCLYHPHARNFLISEAVRGEGGILKRRDGSTFMEKYHPLKSLAPRDIVARAIDNELKESGDDCVYLDITHQDAEWLKERFPTIHGRCLELGIDLTREWIPVVPAAHYACGGVQTDLHARTNIDGLYAAGEVACTGLHGANRLASNSLLEALVFAHAAWVDVQTRSDRKLEMLPIPPWNDFAAPESHETVVVSQNWDEIRRFMWNYVGIVRTNRRLTRALKRIELLQAEIKEYYWDYKITPDVLELRNLAAVAELIVRSALLRHESRGLHFTLDFPQTDEGTGPGDTVLVRETVPLLRPLQGV